jgi:hypothetical protein
MQHHPVIQNPSGDKGLPKKIVEGLVEASLTTPRQERMLDGLITHDRGTLRASKEPVRAVGSYVGAPTMPMGRSVKAENPKTKTKKGMLLPVGQN